MELWLLRELLLHVNDVTRTLEAGTDMRKRHSAPASAEACLKYVPISRPLNETSTSPAAELELVDPIRVCSKDIPHAKEQSIARARRVMLAGKIRQPVDCTQWPANQPTTTGRQAGHREDGILCKSRSCQARSSPRSLQPQWITSDESKGAKQRAQGKDKVDSASKHLPNRRSAQTRKPTGPQQLPCR
ncbi:hypothetical protein CDEST_04897 [Colletotrichum destructivum]|uniref:Uncharacterized protein n=1 Tax=Colletotrichum destructivum TaxID=34406 RepID=A0AAX4IA91_9PEZI|nr:hypothetical protein CDEST_04897 [Colletotrichum destructivum]